MLQIEKENAIRRDARKEGFEEGFDEGYKEGLEESRKEARCETMRKAKKILQDHNLSPEEIQALLMDVYPDDEKMIREIMKTV